MAIDKRSRLGLAAVPLVTLLVGYFLGQFWPQGEEPVPAQTPRADNTTHQSTAEGVSTGHARDEQGAIEAATNFTRVMADVPADAESYLAAIEAMAVPEWVVEARRLGENALKFLRDRYGSDGSFIFAPLKYKVLSYSEADARISVWGVTVASGPKMSGLEESWLTATLDLTWHSDEWRLAGQSSETGPTPELFQAQDQPQPAELDGFREYLHGPFP